VKLGIIEEDTQYGIEVGIPIPSVQRFACKYPFPHMEVGESFTCAPEDYNSVRVGCHNHGKKYGKKFSTRRMPSGGARCWRIA
jgi:hypothetical protein